MKLNRASFERAVAFLMTDGRKLEQTLFRYFLEDGSAQDCIDALAEHQTETGGFIEMGEGGIDGPTPIGSTIAFQHLIDLGAGGDLPIVQRGIDYFLSTFDEEHQVWPPREREAMPRPIADRLPAQWANPSAEIIAYLWRFCDLVPTDFLNHVTDLALQNLRQLHPPIDEFSDMCFLRLAEVLGPSIHDEIIEKVTAGVWDNLQLDHQKWHTRFFVKPYWYARSPDAPLYPLLKEEIDASLSFDMKTQEPDGSFKLTWNTTGRARDIWKSIWALEVLRMFDALGDIEGRRTRVIERSSRQFDVMRKMSNRGDEQGSS